jgi:hypothetical protein
LRRKIQQDYLLLISTLRQLVEDKEDAKVLRSLVGAILRQQTWPHGLHANPKAYTKEAIRLGYVVVGTDDTIQGRDWIQSTGKLERACGGQ